MNQAILKEISPGYSLEGMMLKLKLQYFGHLMQELTHWKRLWCWEGLGAGGWLHWLDRRESEWTLGVGDGQGGLACCDSWGRRVGYDWVTNTQHVMSGTSISSYLEFSKFLRCRLIFFIKFDKFSAIARVKLDIFLNNSNSAYSTTTTPSCRAYCFLACFLLFTVLGDSKLKCFLRSVKLLKSLLRGWSLGYKHIFPRHLSWSSRIGITPSC